MIKRLKTSPGLRLTAVYLAALALWLLWAAGCFAVDRAFGEQQLYPALAASSGLEAAGEGVYRTTDGDPQWVFNNLQAPVRRVVLQAEFGSGPGEMALYYAKPGQTDFSPRRVVTGKPVDGGFEYDLWPGTYSALRIDPGTVPDNRVTVRAILLNPARPFGSYFVPTLRGVLAFALLPALAYAGFCIIIETVRTLRRKVGEKKG